MFYIITPYTKISVIPSHSYITKYHGISKHADSVMLGPGLSLAISSPCIPVSFFSDILQAIITFLALAHLSHPNTVINTLCTVFTFIKGAQENICHGFPQITSQIIGSIWLWFHIWNWKLKKCFFVSPFNFPVYIPTACL